MLRCLFVSPPISCIFSTVLSGHFPARCADTGLTVLIHGSRHNARNAHFGSEGHNMLHINAFLGGRSQKGGGGSTHMYSFSLWSCFHDRKFAVRGSPNSPVSANTAPTLHLPHPLCFGKLAICHSSHNNFGAKGGSVYTMRVAGQRWRAVGQKRRAVG